MIKIIIILIFSIVAANALFVQHKIPKSRIIGGGNVTINDYPYQVSIIRTYSSHRCGGSIIGANVILTAAHCIFKLTPNLLQVRVGSSTKDTGGELIKIEKMWTHELYDKNVLHGYDIGVIILEKKLKYGPTIQPIQMATREVQNGEDAIVSGWGKVQENGNSSVELKAVHIRIISNSNCRIVYGEKRLTDEMMCAGVPEGGKGSCQGDSGGPLVVNGKLVGVVSFARGCSRPNIPTVFANVFFLKDWIESQINI